MARTGYIVDEIIDEVPEGAYPSYEATTGHQNHPAPEPTNQGDAWGAIYKLAKVGPYGPSNREERRRVEKVLRRLKKRGLTVG